MTEQTGNDAERARLAGKTEPYDFDDLCRILAILRGEGGCPWDRKQTHESLRQSLIEETYEVVEAIDLADPVLLREELGDLLLQVVFHARLAEEEGRFDMGGVADGICRKLIRRHPHVFGSVRAETAEEVVANWERIKGEEKRRVTVTDSLRAIPRVGPALLRAQKAGEKAACFDFPDAEAVFRKLDEEIQEVRAAADAGDAQAEEDEIGDLLLAVTSLARKLNVRSEEALCRATDRFIRRFARLEEATLAEGKRMDETPAEELNAVWDRIKRLED